jgi:DNA-directed RNA polymerase subunit RPC12/RpoP
MSKYLTTKKGSLEDMVAGVTEGKQSEDYKQLFKKELEKTGKGIGSMSDMEKKAFFNNIDKKHSAKNEGSKEIQTKNMRTSPGEGTGAAGGPKLKESVELEEGGVKDFLMDVEDDASDMSLNDLIKKYYGQMGLSAQEIKKIYYRVNEELTAGQKKLPPALQKAIKDKENKKEVKEESEEETKSLTDAIHSVWNQAAKEEETREDKAKYYKPVEEEKKSLNEEKIKCPNCGHMNDADAHKCSNCGASLNSESEDKNGKKKAMTGSPASKVDTTPEVEYDK